MEIKNAIKKNWAYLHDQSTSGLLLRLGWFIIIYFISGQIYSIIKAVLVFYTVEDFVHQPNLWIIFNCTVNILYLFYSDLSTIPDYIIIIGKLEIIHLNSGCSGLDPLFRITIALILYPLRWKTKIYLFPFSWFMILFAATVHFILLFFTSYYLPQYYALSHNWVTIFIFYMFYFFTWLIWEKVGYRK